VAGDFGGREEQGDSGAREEQGDSCAREEQGDSCAGEEQGVRQPEVPPQYVLSAFAPEPRTLIDILYDTTARHPDAPALDDGAVQLTYAELIAVG